MKQKRIMKIAMAPLEGITTYVFRNAYNKYYGGVDRYFTPFLTASHLKGRELREVHPDNNKGLDVVPQILSNDSEQFLVIAEQLAALGYKEVNLNLGCPSGTVVSKHRGVGMLSDPKELDRFLDGIFEGREGLEISVKTRIGMEFMFEWEDILSVYIKYPINELIIHPRLRNEFYKGEVHLDAYKMAEKLYREKENCQTDFCYNGDIVDEESFDRIMGELYPDSSFGDDFHVMIGRGLLMNPNLPNQLKGQEASFDKKLFKEFMSEITENYKQEMTSEKQVVMKMKELWLYFAKGLGLSDRQLKEVLKTSRLADYKAVVQMVLS
ncbi:MAG: tRNA-dihydrouridine synthase family protein, partial [Eubacterium sp.]|nr:tRNA-dihydrouridine synthase family protein [Eubacterium sp.]